MEELTYLEHLEAKLSLKIKAQHEVLRNVSLNDGDIDDDLLTESFFNRKDIGNNKMEILEIINNELIDLIDGISKAKNIL